jgi:hypothetical protein
MFLETMANAVSQASTPPSNPGAGTPLPNDPAELMRVARRSDGIAAGDSQPWHLKAIYQVFASDGKKSGEGVYEVFFANLRKYKQSYAGKSFSQVVYSVVQAEYSCGPNRFVNQLICRDSSRNLSGSYLRARSALASRAGYGVSRSSSPVSRPGCDN